MTTTFIRPAGRILGALLTAALCAGCDAPATTGAAWPAFGGFAIGDFTLGTRHFAGAEAIRLNLVIAAPSGRYIRSYGIKTPYEETVRPIQPRLPMPIANGQVVLKLESFTRLPKAGAMPVEFWLVNESGETSNRIADVVVIQ